ncbi:hypothetical protein QC763_0055650 [Podospora pseudopauciseta]|uniref:Uncharacterized protein n=2 Tax=Podospora TaxID=5144 RepID=A0ABR0HGS5_9PEZI|nr:hypothetical protein QC763_0055650 [Podospora pseudopauciseta]KAK4678451.1 hypothetical protein QC764_0055380 [Podospora pseudoanserina]
MAQQTLLGNPDPGMGPPSRVKIVTYRCPTPSPPSFDLPVVRQSFDRFGLSTTLSPRPTVPKMFLQT